MTSCLTWALIRALDLISLLFSMKTPRFAIITGRSIHMQLKCCDNYLLSLNAIQGIGSRTNDTAILLTRIEQSWWCQSETKNDVKSTRIMNDLTSKLSKHHHWHCFVHDWYRPQKRVRVVDVLFYNPFSFSLHSFNFCRDVKRSLTSALSIILTNSTTVTASICS